MFRLNLHNMRHPAEAMTTFRSLRIQTDRQQTLSPSKTRTPTTYNNYNDDEHQTPRTLFPPSGNSRKSNPITLVAISSMFIVMIIISLKHSSDFMKGYLAMISTTDLLMTTTAGNMRRTNRLRRNFILEPKEFHFLDLDALRQRKINMTSNCKKSNDTSSKGCSSVLDNNNPATAKTDNDDGGINYDEQPIQVTLLVKKNRGQWRRKSSIDYDADDDDDDYYMNQSSDTSEDFNDTTVTNISKQVEFGNEEERGDTKESHIPNNDTATNNQNNSNNTDVEGEDEKSGTREIDSAIQSSKDEAGDSVIFWDKNTLKTLRGTEGIPPDTKVQVSDILGRISDNNQLVVDVDKTYLFWREGQSRLCDLLRAMTLRSNLEDEVPDLFREVHPKPPLLNVTLNCLEMQKTESFGQGNWVTAVYAFRLAAARAQVDHQFQCSDGRDSQMKLLLPWFDGYHAAPSTVITKNNTTKPSWPYFGGLPSQSTVCTDQYNKIRVDRMANLIVDDIQRMAVTLVGTRDEIRKHPSIPEDQEPLIPGVELDDVVIHFRCGDVMGGAKRDDFGMIKFDEYKKWISPDTQRIGILTQPFQKELNRQKDAGRVKGCRKATYALVDTLREFLPSNNVTITIHNGPNETLPLAYARLAMANQSFTSLSTFGIMPVIGTFGQGYFQKGNRGVNPFTEYLPKYLPNLHEMNAPKLSTGKMFNMNVDDIVEWLTSS